MQFKTAAEIRAARDAAGKNAEREEKAKAKLAERASRKYARMAEEAAKREAAAKAKPKLVVNRENVIVAPALLAERKPSKQSNFGTAQIENAVARRNKEEVKKKAQADIEAIRNGTVSPSKGGEPHTVVPDKKARQGQKNRDFGKNYGTTSMPKAESKQVWDEATKTWVRR